MLMTFCLAENMRREGYELSVSPPVVVYRSVLLPQRLQHSAQCIAEGPVHVAVAASKNVHMNPTSLRVAPRKQCA